MSDMFELDPTVREFVDRVARKVLASTEVSEPLHVTIEDLGERTYRVGFHSGDEIKRLRAENAALLHRADRAERILHALREPSNAVVLAADKKIPILYRLRDTKAGIIAAVAAAEVEVGDA